jgi:hypothetical protein
MRLINRKDMEFLKPQRKVKEEERMFIKESNKTKLFVNKEGCYISDNRQDTGEYREYEISSLIQITEETVPINEKDEYIILYENSKGEDILVSGKKNRDYGQGKFRIGKSAKMITQKGLQLVYNLNTKTLHERKVNVKQDFVQEEKPEEFISGLYPGIYTTVSGEISFSERLHNHIREELSNHVKTDFKNTKLYSGSISSYITELKIDTQDEQPTIERTSITERIPFE